MYIKIVWDEPKRLSNISKHGLDFAELIDDFFDAALTGQGKLGRLVAIGRHEGGIVTVVFRGLEPRPSRSSACGRPVPSKGNAMKPKEFDPAQAAAQGYTKEDWDAVDSPELTPEELARMRPFREVFPDLAASIQRSRGRPKVDAPKAAVTLRLDPATVDRFKASGPDWRAKMARALDKAKV